MDPPDAMDFSTLQPHVRKEKSLYKFHLTYLRYASTVFHTLTELYFFLKKKQKKLSPPCYNSRGRLDSATNSGYVFRTHTLSIVLAVPPHIPHT